MALILKPGKLFVNPNIGGQFNQAYLRVGRFTYDKDIRNVEFFLLTYVSASDRQLNRQPMLVEQINASGNEFDNHFAPEILNTTDNIIKAIYQYLLQIKGDDDTPKYSDWDSDVV